VVEAGGRLLALNIETPSLDEIYTRYFKEVEHVVAA
jgi:ABC-2 type transport system ATP-binding protein